MSTMYSKVKIAGHPIHPMLVVFPVTFYTTTLLGFVMYAATGNLFWWRVALWANVAGVVMAIVAAIPGFIDWAIGIPRSTTAKATGLKHMLLNVSALLLFAINLLVHRDRWIVAERVVGVATTDGGVRTTITDAGVIMAPDASTALLLTGLGFLLTMGAGFLGWTLVQTHHVGVDLNEEQKRLEPRTTDSSHSRPMVQS